MMIQLPLLMNQGRPRSSGAQSNDKYRDRQDARRAEWEEADRLERQMWIDGLPRAVTIKQWGEDHLE